jgi:hypothetical protein
MTTPDDAQRRAYADAGAADWAAEADLLADAVVHRPDDPNAEPIRTPEEWDVTGWDEDRDGPKSIDEARAALAARITDPHAPDTEAVASAYDELEDNE